MVAQQATFRVKLMLSEQTLTELKLYVKRSMNKDVFIMEHINQNVLDSSSQIEKIKDYIDHHRKPTFQQKLFQFIDHKGVSDASIYKKAWLDRRHFSKIRSDPNYRISKNNAIALAFALELTLTEAEELLGAAGFSLSDSHTSDLVIKFCLKNKIHNLHEVNEALTFLNEKPLTNHR